jgi:hypothetical protein
MFINKGQVRLGYLLKSYFHIYFVQMLGFEAESALQVAEYRS